MDGMGLDLRVGGGIEHLTVLIISHHKAFIGMDDIEEAEKDIDGDNLEGVKDDNAELHVARAVEARSCLLSIGFVGVF